MQAVRGDFRRFCDDVQGAGRGNLRPAERLKDHDEEMIKKLPTYHVILLAKNDIGRINLYRLVSLSHLTYYARRPRIPRGVFKPLSGRAHHRLRLRGRGAVPGLLRGAPESEIARLVRFYDYLEIQPLGNNAFMLRDEKSTVKTEEDLKELNRRIVRLGEQFGKLVCATCDVHFLDPQDEVYRRIIMAGQGFKGFRRPGRCTFARRRKCYRSSSIWGRTSLPGGGDQYPQGGGYV